MKLTIHDPSGARASVPFRGDALSVGRQDGNDILLPAENVSRRHCRFVRTASGVEVEDLGSKGGVTVDGVTVCGRALVEPGQIVSVGPYVLVLGALGEETPARPWSLERVARSAHDVPVLAFKVRLSSR